MRTIYLIVLVIVASTCLIVNNIMILRSINSGSRNKKFSILNLANPEHHLPSSFSPLLRFSHGAVSSDSVICSQIGSNLLKQNGSAVDAALATLLCNGLVTMQSNGLGGGMLLIYYSRKEQKSFAVLGREVAPLLTYKINLNKVENATRFLQSVHTIGVPAEVIGYAEIHERFGVLDWKTIVEPTLNICYKGFKLTKHMRDALLMNRERVLKDQHLSEMFFDSQLQDFHHYGKIIHPTMKLCKTYESLSLNGPRSYHRGLLSRKLLADLSDIGSYIRKKDFKQLKVRLFKAQTIQIDDLIFHLMPPPGSGFIIGFIMNILKSFRNDFQKSRIVGDLEIHRIVEALKFGFIERWKIDTQFTNKEALNVLLNSTYAAEIAKLIENFTLTDMKHYGVKRNISSYREHGTGHVSVIAPNGDAVSITSSVNFYFGSGRTGKRTGILFNNVMSDFALNGITNHFNLPNFGSQNKPRPGKSPMSSMAPTIITDNLGNVKLVIGAAGGSKIISVLVQVLIRSLWMKNNIKDAVDAARFHHQLVPNVLEYEYGVLQNCLDKLKSRGHKCKRYRDRGSIVNALEKTEFGINGCVDFRKEGGVVGF